MGEGSTLIAGTKREGSAAGGIAMPMGYCSEISPIKCRLWREIGLYPYSTHVVHVL